MEPKERTQGVDHSDARPSFRKPANDAAGSKHLCRNYRRHSPVGGSDASLSDDSPRRGRKTDAYSSREDRPRKGEKKTRDDMADSDRDRHHRAQRDNSSHRQRQTYTAPHNHHRSDGHDRDRRDDYDRSYYRPRFSHDPRDGNRSPYSRKDGNSDRSREASQKSEKYHRDKSDDGPRNEDKSVDRSASQCHGYNDADSALHGSKHVSRKDERAMEHVRFRDRQTQDDRREHSRSPENYNCNQRSYDDVRGRLKDYSGKDFDGNEETPNRRKRDRKEFDKDRDLYDRESGEHIRGSTKSSYSRQERERRNAVDEAGQSFRDRNSPRKKKSDHLDGFTENAKMIQEPKTVFEVEKPDASSSKFSSEPTFPSINQDGATVNHGAATISAMKAAELVNRNIMGGGLSITEQKKKLLWGNKKNSEESTSQWDLSLFPDRERQEKFKKLMGVKGELKLETKPDDKDVSLRAKQQEELQMDLEKQYTAGLRRRDGRTVGLGL